MGSGSRRVASGACTPVPPHATARWPPCLLVLMPTAAGFMQAKWILWQTLIPWHQKYMPGRGFIPCLYLVSPHHRVVISLTRWFKVILGICQLLYRVCHMRFYYCVTGALLPGGGWRPLAHVVQREVCGGPRLGRRGSCCRLNRCARLTAFPFSQSVN